MLSIWKSSFVVAVSKDLTAGTVLSLPGIVSIANWFLVIGSEVTDLSEDFRSSCSACFEKIGFSRVLKCIELTAAKQTILRPLVSFLSYIPSATDSRLELQTQILPNTNAPKLMAERYGFFTRTGLEAFPQFYLARKLKHCFWSLFQQGKSQSADKWLSADEASWFQP